ncbi:MAG TPA: CAP domain-containing protein [Candidatus Limnocylindrales bacterium]|jgi:uncharacterized protein YkwD|nr:CAP domain-containing protein [Candidatus Limnocylindrales bacterium]
MRSHIRRFGPLVLGLAMLVAMVPAGVAAGSADLDPATRAAAEQHALDVTNQRRVDRGLIRLRLDTRLRELARERAQYMADSGEFAHVQSDGTTVFSMIAASGMTWYAAGEIIAWNTAGPLDYSAEFAVQGWMGSPTHRAILLSDDYNYVGFGLAVAADGTRYWAGVYLRGPDRTPGWARTGSWTKVNIDRTWARVTARWSGGDTRLQVLTAGLKTFQVQIRKDLGTWHSYVTTSATSVTHWLARHHRYDLRVRSIDRAGNRSAWRVTTYYP